MNNAHIDWPHMCEGSETERRVLAAVSGDRAYGILNRHQLFRTCDIYPQQCLFCCHLIENFENGKKK